MNDLPQDYLTFAKQMGYKDAEHWSKSRGKMENGWQHILSHVAEGKNIKGIIRDFLGRMRAADLRLQRHKKKNGNIDARSVSTILALFSSVYPQYAIKPKVPAAIKKAPKVVAGSQAKKKPINDKTYRPERIGLGLESTFKPAKIKRDAVVIDAHTRSKSSPDKNILYAPGWSVNGAFNEAD